jgi:hypothetical protein
MHVLSVHFKCFGCFRDMLQVFDTVVIKIDRDVAYVAIVVHVCCKSLSPMFNLFSRLMLQVCLSGCYKYFTHTLQLQVFYLDVAYVCNVFQVFF